MTSLRRTPAPPRSDRHGHTAASGQPHRQAGSTHRPELPYCTSEGRTLGQTSVMVELVFPDAVVVSASADGKPLIGAGLTITIPTTRNPLILLPLGPTDSSGSFVVSGQVLERMAADEVGLFPADCGTLLPELWISILNRTDLARRREGYRTWGGSARFGHDYLGRLDAYDCAVASLAGALLTASATSQGGTFVVRCTSQRA